MDVLGYTLTDGAVWILGGATWGISTLATFRLGRHSAADARYHAAADRFRKGINELASDVPEPGVYPNLGAYGLHAEQPMTEFTTSLQRHVDDFLPFVGGKDRAALAGDVKAVLSFARDKNLAPRVGLIPPRPTKDSDQKIMLREMTRRLATFAPEKNGWF